MAETPLNVTFKLYRRYLRLSQSDLAGKMGTTQTSVARWESAESPITPLVMSYAKALVQIKLQQDIQTAFASIMPEIRLCDFEGLYAIPSTAFTFDSRGNGYLGLIEIMGHREHALYISVENGGAYAIDREGRASAVDRDFLNSLKVVASLRERAKVKDDPLFQRKRIVTIAQQAIPDCEVVFDNSQPLTWVRFRLDDPGTGTILGTPSGHYHISEIADWPDDKLRDYIRALNPYFAMRAQT